jgi:hypothetical protein
MEFEAIAVMVVGIGALATIRLLLAVVGRSYAADHAHPCDDTVAAPTQAGTQPPVRARRGTGRRNRHLVYFEPDVVVPVPVVPAPVVPPGDNAGRMRPAS